MKNIMLKRTDKEALDYLANSLYSNDAGFYTIKTSCEYWEIKTSKNDDGEEFIKFEDTIFKVNSIGNAWAGRYNEKQFRKMIKKIGREMIAREKKNPMEIEKYTEGGIECIRSVKTFRYDYKKGDIVVYYDEEKRRRTSHIEGFFPDDKRILLDRQDVYYMDPKATKMVWGWEELYSQIIAQYRDGKKI